MGYGGTMGGERSPWWPPVWLALRLGSPLVLLGGGYLRYRRATERREARDPAMEELHMAYARGELSDEEFRTRRENLDRERYH